MSLRGTLRRVGGWRRGCWALALLALAALAALRVPRETHTTAEFPHHSAELVAHFLADFSNHPQLYDHLSGSWRLEEESSNHSWWRYIVSYECGARCAGRAELLAGSDAPPEHRQHGQPAPHRVLLRDQRCRRLLALPWPVLCEHLEVKAAMWPRVGGGARLEEVARVSCGALATVAGLCDVRAARLSHHRALQDALPAAPHIN